MYSLTCHITTFKRFETEKAIGFKVCTGVSHSNIGMKYFPKSKIQINYNKYADPNTVEIIVPDWLMRDISKNSYLDMVEID